METPTPRHFFNVIKELINASKVIEANRLLNGGRRLFKDHYLLDFAEAEILQVEDPKYAHNLLMRGLKKAEASNNKEDLVHGHSRLAYLFQQRSLLDESIQHLQKVIEILNELNDYNQSSMFKFDLAALQIKTNHEDTWKKMVEEAVSYLRNSGEISVLVFGLEKIVAVLGELNREDIAVEYLGLAAYFYDYLHDNLHAGVVFLNYAFMLIELDPDLHRETIISRLKSGLERLQYEVDERVIESIKRAWRDLELFVVKEEKKKVRMNSERYFELRKLRFEIDREAMQAMKIGEKGRRNEAQKRLFQVLKRDPTNTIAHLGLMAVGTASGNTKLSCHHGAEILRIDPYHRYALDYFQTLIPLQWKWLDKIVKDSNSDIRNLIDLVEPFAYLHDPYETFEWLKGFRNNTDVQKCLKRIQRFCVKEIQRLYILKDNNPFKRLVSYLQLVDVKIPDDVNFPKEILLQTHNTELEQSYKDKTYTRPHGFKFRRILQLEDSRKELILDKILLQSIYDLCNGK